jgi:hypothetical protein
MSSVGSNAGAWQGASNAMNNTNWMGSSNNAIGQWNNSLSNQGSADLASAQMKNENTSNTWGTIAGLGSMAAMAMMAEGGEVQGPEGRDAIPAKLSHGEFVVPEDVVRRKGTEFFEKLIDKTQQDQGERDAQMQAQQQKEQAYQQGMMSEQQVEAPMQRPPMQQMPQQQPPMPQQPVMMAEGGAATGAAPATPRYSGRNPRPMFGYNSALAKRGEQQANQATADRQDLMDRLRTEIKNREWQNVKPDWQPQEVERSNFDIAGTIAAEKNRRAQEANAARAHELAMAEAAAKGRGGGGVMSIAERLKDPQAAYLGSTDDAGVFTPPTMARDAWGNWVPAESPNARWGSSPISNQQLSTGAWDPYQGAGSRSSGRGSSGRGYYGYD